MSCLDKRTWNLSSAGRDRCLIQTSATSCRVNAKAKAAYQDFLALWKDADPDTPILKQAKTEYAKLQ